MKKSKPEYGFHPDDPDSTAASVVRFALTGGSEVLDIGSCGSQVPRYLATEHARSVTCVDSDRNGLSSLAESGLRTIDADIENDDWDAEESGFDVVILADVLQRVREPEQLLARLLGRGLLNPDGILVVSVPNAANGAVISELLHGDIASAESGLLDQSHLRWFTLASLQRLLERAGFLIDRVDRTTRSSGSSPAGERTYGIPESIRHAIKELNVDSDVHQYVVRAVVDSSATRVSRERQHFEEERRAWAHERDGLHRETSSLRAELERVSALLREERAAFAAELVLGAGELDSCDQEIARLQNRRDRLLRQRNEARRALSTSLYEESRGVRFAVRVVRGLRELRGPRD